MKHLILHLGQLSSDLESATFSSYNLEDLSKRKELNQIETSLKAIDEKDLLPYQVSCSLPKEKFESIIIFKAGFRWDEVIRLAVYLRLLPDENWISKTPIIICWDNLPNPINDRDLANITDIQNFLNIPGIFNKHYFEIFERVLNEEGNTDYNIKSVFKNFITPSNQFSKLPLRY